MPKVNVNVQLKELDGTGLMEKGKPLTAQAILINSLVTPVPGENVDGVEKYKRYRLASRISKNDEAQLSSEDIVLLKANVGKLYFPLIVGQIYDILEPPAE